MHSSNLGKQYGVSFAALLRVAAVGRPLYLQIKDVRSFALVEDEQDLGQMTVTSAGLDKDDLIDPRLEEG